MIRFILIATFVLLAFESKSQKVPLINAGEVVERARILYDSGKYEASIREYLSIPKRDTSYVTILPKLAEAYLGNGQFDEALSLCEEGLKSPSIYRANYLLTRSRIFDKKGDTNKALTLLKEALSEYPFSVPLHYNLALFYYNHKEMDKAVDEFFYILSLNPFHSGCHLYLGVIFSLQGRKTHAALAFGTYLSIRTEDNSRLVFLDKLLSNQVSDEGSVSTSEKSACDRMDQILRSKVALEESFKTSYPVTAPVVKQFELFFQQLDILVNAKGGKEDRVLNQYLPFYKAIKDQNHIEAFMYNMLTSTSNENVKKWIQKNDKQLQQFYTVANQEISNRKKEIAAPASWNFSEPIRAWTDSQSYVDGIGNKNAENQHIGKWVFFHVPSCAKSAEGLFDGHGKKIGTWTYFHPDGVVKSIENHQTGEVVIKNQEGDTLQYFFLKGDVIEGAVKIYHECGSLKEKAYFKAGARDGAAKEYYADGKLETENSYKAGQLDGKYLSYYQNGKINTQCTYEAGELVGRYSEFHPDGKLKSEGEYKAGSEYGKWTYHHTNGKMQRTGAYEKGLPVGEWTYYDVQGELTIRRTFNSKGLLQGESKFYDAGLLTEINTYKEDVLTGITFYDLKGKEIARYGNGDGTFKAKLHYLNGQVKGEGSYKKGKIEGPWKYYYPEGLLLSEYTYKEGELQGLGKEYFRGGQLRYDLPYKDSQLDGYFQEFSVSGNVVEEGWFVKGNREQQWLSYRSDGTLESDSYYLLGKAEKEHYTYYADGKISSATAYNDGKITDIRSYNPTGELSSKVETKSTQKIYHSYFSQSHEQSTIQCGLFAAHVVYYPDGTVLNTTHWMNGIRYGHYEQHFVNKKISVEGDYLHGLQNGRWRWYYANGQVDNEGIYVNGESDSLWTFYFPDGKISSISTYQNGKRNGISKINSPEGLLLLEKYYEDGSLSAYRTMKKDGQLGDWKLFTKDASIVIHYANGSKAYEEHFKNGLIDGTRTIYFASGAIYSIYGFSQGDYEGPFKIYYANGTVFESGTYKNDQLEGVHELFYENGKPLVMEHFLAGDRHGEAKYYDEKGEIKSCFFSTGIPLK